MWRRQREDDGGLQSVIQFLRMTGTENVLPVVVAPVVVLKVSIVFSIAQYVLRSSTFRYRPTSLSQTCLNSPHTSRQVNLY